MAVHMRQANLTPPTGVASTVVVTPNPLPVVGTVTNNAAAPVALTMLGTLTAIANAANPTWTEGRLVALSVDLSGNLRIRGSNGMIDATWNPSSGYPLSGVGILAQYVTPPPSLTSGMGVPLQCNGSGVLFIRNFRRSLTIGKTVTIANSAAAVTIFAAQSSGVFLDISQVFISVLPLAAGTAPISFTATLSDGTNNYIFDLQAVQIGTAVLVSNPLPPLNVNFNPPILETNAATAWTLTLSVATVTVHVNIQGILTRAD
jgi:hypothetical protein